MGNIAREISQLRACVDGDAAAFEAIVSKYQSFVCAITYSATGDVDKSEELAQETFVNAWRNLAQLNDLGKFRAWLRSIAKSVIMNWLRAKKREKRRGLVSLDQVEEIASVNTEPVEMMISKEQQAVVRDALEMVSEKYREVMVLYYRQGQSVGEVAEQLELSKSAVRQRLSRGRKQLKKQVTSMVETTIKGTGPGKAFTIGVAAAVAGIAVKGAAVAAVGTVSVSGGTTGAGAVASGGGIPGFMGGVAGKIVAAAAVVVIGVGAVVVYNNVTGSTAKTDLPVAVGLTDREEIVQGAQTNAKPKAVKAGAGSVVAKVVGVQVDPAGAEGDGRGLNAGTGKGAADTVAAEEKEKVVYRGRVVDESGKAVSGAMISREWVTMTLEHKVEKDVSVTDEKGWFETDALAPVGDSMESTLPYLIFDHPDYAVGWWDARKTADPNGVQVTLFAPAMVAGVVTDPEGLPVVGAIVEASVRVKVSPSYYYMHFMEMNEKAVFTNADGWFAFERLPHKAGLDITAAHIDYGQYSTTVEYEGEGGSIHAGESDLEITISPGGFIRGRLVMDGKPYAKEGVIVAAAGPGRRSNYSLTVTDEKGEFVTNGLYAGEHVVMPLSKEFGRDSAVCEPLTGIEVGGAGEVTEVELVVRRGIAVTVLVVDEVTGETLSGVNVSARLPEDVPVLSADSNTDAEGKCVLRLDGGKYVISANGWKDGRLHAFKKDITVDPAKGAMTVEIAIGARPYIYGRLVDADGDPVCGSVALGSEAAVETDDAGQFAIPEPWSSPGDVYTGFAFDKGKKLGRGFLRKTEKEDDLEIVLEPLAGIVGRIVDADGAGVNGVVPRINILLGGGTSRGANSKLYKLTVEDGGLFAFDGVPVGLEMKVSAEKPGYQGRVELGELTGGEIVDAGDVVLKPLHGFEDKVDWTGTLSGRVIDERGDAVVGYRIDTSVGTERFKDVTDWRGRYKLKGLPKGKKLQVGGYLAGYGHCSEHPVVDGNDFDLQIFPQGWELLNKEAPGIFVENWINCDPVTLKDYRGKVVLLQIGVLLPNYLRDFRQVEKLYEKYADKGFEIIAVHQRLDISWAGKVTEKGIADYVAKYKIKFPFGIDAKSEKVRHLTPDRQLGNGAMYSLYGVKATPALYLIDKQGVLRISPKRDELEDWVRKLLAE